MMFEAQQHADARLYVQASAPVCCGAAEAIRIDTGTSEEPMLEFAAATFAVEVIASVNGPAASR